MIEEVNIPVITIDGPSGCGKGTIAEQLADHLHWHWLDSGALYRMVAWAVLHYQIPPNHDSELESLLSRIKITQLNCDGHDVSQAIRTEACAKMASEISAKPFVRAALLQKQRDLRQLPGLIADGRDMGTVVFPDAQAKFFLTARPEIRAQRRYDQLIKLGIPCEFDQICTDLMIRDKRDRERPIAPLQPAAEAIIIDTGDLSISEVLAKVISHLNP